MLDEREARGENFIPIQFRWLLERIWVISLPCMISGEWSFIHLIKFHCPANCAWRGDIWRNWQPQFSCGWLSFSVYFVIVIWSRPIFLYLVALATGCSESLVYSAVHEVRWLYLSEIMHSDRDVKCSTILLMCFAVLYANISFTFVVLRDVASL